MNMFLKGRFKISQNQHGVAGQKGSHDGLDIVALGNDLNVYSNVEGQVTYAGWENPNVHSQGFGLYVRIRKDGTNHDYYFGHLSSINVKVGDRVSAGQILGIQGNTGYSFGRHTHFCVRVDKSKTNVLSAWDILGLENRANLEYTAELTNANANQVVEVKCSVDEMAQRVINGEYGKQPERQQRLEAEGYNYREIQDKVNEILKGKTKLSNEEVAQKVINGEYGNQPVRQQRLEAEGYNYEVIRAIVNARLK